MDFELELIVKKVILPTSGIMRRLKLWSLTDGFIVSTPKQMDMKKFYEEMENTEDDALLALTRVDISHVEDWSDLIDVLRSCEQLFEGPLGLDDSLIDFEVSVTVRFENDRQPAQGITARISSEANFDELASEVTLSLCFLMISIYFVVLICLMFCSLLLHSTFLWTVSRKSCFKFM